MKPPQISVLDGSTFAVSDTNGDIQGDLNGPFGLFFRDTRHLSRWKLTLDGRDVDSLTSETISYDEAVFFLTAPTSINTDPTVSIVRRRNIGNGMREHLTVENNGLDPVHLELAIQFDADFADIFEIKSNQTRGRNLKYKVDGSFTSISYTHDDFHRETRITAKGAHMTHRQLTYQLHLAPHERWETNIELELTTDTYRHQIKPQSGVPNMEQSLEDWLEDAPALSCDWDDLRRTYYRSLVDLAALRFYPGYESDAASLPAAGLPWFMALFGRDSLVTSYQSLPFVPELARTTLHALAALQATKTDDFRDADPGKILHELRHGETVHFGENTQSPYYGSADVTPLFLILLDEYELWTGDEDTIRQLEPAARAALQWIDDFGDSDHDGYVEYQTRNPSKGLGNQCWKDSWNSIVHPDGTLADLPRATCEIQGYVYDARRRMARLARAFWNNAALADQLEKQADELREQFNKDFWIEDEGFYALALDGKKQPVATLASNMGHLLWSGILPDDRAHKVADRLMSEAMFTGWGIRTMADGQAAYNPIEYHNGTVWPHDNAFITMGLARYGRYNDAARIAQSVLTAANYFDHRLPEVFAGFSKDATLVPVEYPTACSPQAWAAATPLLLIRVLLGLQPDGDELRASPLVQEEIGAITLTGIPGRWGKTNATTGPVDGKLGQ